MLRQSARLRQSGYYLPDGSPRVSYRDTLKRKDNTNRSELCDQFNKQWQSGINTKFGRQMATPVVSPPDRRESVKSLAKQITPVRRETSSFTDHRVTPNNNGTPSLNIDRITPNNNGTPSLNVDRITPNNNGTPSFSVDRVTPNNKETQEGSVDRVTPEIKSSSDTRDKSARGLFGWIGIIFRWLIILLLVVEHVRLFSYEVFLVPRGPVNGTFYNHSACQTQDPTLSNCSDLY